LIFCTAAGSANAAAAGLLQVLSGKRRMQDELLVSLDLVQFVNIIRTCLNIPVG
jgi:hypothetical protein